MLEVLRRRTARGRGAGRHATWPTMRAASRAGGQWGQLAGGSGRSLQCPAAAWQHARRGTAKPTACTAPTAARRLSSGASGNDYGVGVDTPKPWAKLNDRQRGVIAELGWSGGAEGSWDANDEHPRWHHELTAADRLKASSIGFDKIQWDTKKCVAAEAVAGGGGSWDGRYRSVLIGSIVGGALGAALACLLTLIPKPGR